MSQVQRTLGAAVLDGKSVRGLRRVQGIRDRRSNAIEGARWYADRQIRTDKSVAKLRRDRRGDRTKLREIQENTGSGITRLSRTNCQVTSRSSKRVFLFLVMARSAFGQEFDRVTSIIRRKSWTRRNIATRKRGRSEGKKKKTRRRKRMNRFGIEPVVTRRRNASPLRNGLCKKKNEETGRKIGTSNGELPTS